MSFTSAQCRAARALLNWSQDALAKASKVATKTIADFERESRTPYDRTLADIQRALESAGVEFTNGGQPGVRMRTFRPGDEVVYLPNGEPGVVTDRRPTMGGMVWVEFRDGPQCVEIGRLATPASNPRE
jgi:transcriptional regulator with XRE-family HTH domain